MFFLKSDFVPSKEETLFLQIWRMGYQKIRFLIGYRTDFKNVNFT